MLISKTFLTYSAVSMLIFSGCTTTINNGYRFDFKGENESKSLDLEIPPESTVLDLTNLHGNVTIATSQEGRASLHWEVTSWADTSEEATRQLEQIQLANRVDGGVFKCEVLLPTEQKELLRGVRSNITVVVPASMSVNLQNSFGNIEAHQVASRLNLTGRHGDIQAIGLNEACQVTNAHGNIKLQDVVAATVENAHGDTTVTSVHDSLKLKSAHGQVTVTGAMGDVDVATSHDDISLSNITGSLIARNSHGDIFGDQLHGSRLDVESSFGTIDLTSAASEVECRNQHGEIKLTAVGDNLHRISAKTSFKSVTITLPGDCQPDAKTSCTFGKVTSDFDDSTKQGPSVEVDVQHGDIQIIRLPLAEKA